MEKILLDTNFIISCVKKKIDFFEQLQDFDILIPNQIIQELEKLTKKGKLVDRETAKLSLDILAKNQRDFEIINLKNKNVDKGIVNYIEKNQKTVLATLDKKLREKLKNKIKIMAIRSKIIIEL